MRFFLQQATMNCQDVQKFAFTYLDGEFDSRERAEFEEHLRLCQTCRQQISRDALFKDMSARHLGLAATAKAPHVCPKALRARVCAGLDESERRRRSQAIAVPVALAATIGLAFVSWQVIPGDTPASDRAGPNLLAGGQAAAPIAMEPAVAAAAVAAPPQAAQQVHGQAPQQAGGPAVSPRGPAQLAGTGSASVRSARLPVQLASTGGTPGANRLELPADGSEFGNSEFGSVRTEECVRNMVRSHTAELPPEVTGSPLRIQRYLQTRLPGLGAGLPLAQGAGVELLGARISLIGEHPVVVYRYQAYGVALTVFSRPRVVADTDEGGELRQPGQPRHTGLLLDRHQGLQLLHVVGSDRVLTLVSELGAPQMLQLLSATATL